MTFNTKTFAQFRVIKKLILVLSVRALYSTTHPEYEKYLYLIAPISVAFLNPIGFFLMEYHKWRKSTRSHRKTK